MFQKLLNLQIIEAELNGLTFLSEIITKIPRMLLKKVSKLKEKKLL